MWITFRRPSPFSKFAWRFVFLFVFLLPTPFSFMNAKIHDDHILVDSLQCMLHLLVVYFAFYFLFFGLCSRVKNKNKVHSAFFTCITQLLQKIMYPKRIVKNGLKNAISWFGILELEQFFFSWSKELKSIRMPYLFVFIKWSEGSKQEMKKTTKEVSSIKMLLVLWWL